MARRWPTFVLLVLTLGFGSSLASAAEPEGCPPDAWFCEDAEAAPASPPKEPGSTEVPAEPASEPREQTQGSATWTSDEPSGEAPRIDLETADDAANEAGGAASDAKVSPWSVNLRVQWALLGDSSGHDSGMGGAGVSLRYLVTPVLTLDLGVDSIFGTDYNGYDRGELGLSFSTLLFLNRHPAIRTYVIFGLNLSAAYVGVGGDERNWNYFGAHTGLGLEIPLARQAALSFEFLGFVRGRIDSAAAQEPEFTDSLGRVTNTAGGGVFRVGVNIFW